MSEETFIMSEMFIFRKNTFDYVKRDDEYVTEKTRLRLALID